MLYHFSNLYYYQAYKYSNRFLQNAENAYYNIMSSIFIQIGQCGCQIGHKVNKKLSNSYYSTRIHPPNKIHSIMIDTQPKVLKPFIDNPPKWLDPTNVKYFQYGRGNNWSYGYMHELPLINVVTEFIPGYKQYSHLTKKQRQQKTSLDVESYEEVPSTIKHRSKSPLISKKESIQKKIKHQTTPEKSPKPSPKKQWNSGTNYEPNEGPIVNADSYPSLTQFEQKVLINKYLKQNRQICDYTLEKIRKELDTMDCPSAINILCSLGGGTGSGLGTKIIQKIYDEFNMDIYAHVVLPNKSGQTPLQIYNCTLSLASIQEHCTAIFTYENDNMINMFLPHLNANSESTPFKGSDLDFINEQISQVMGRFFKINDLENYNQFYSQIVNQCVLSNQLKYLSLFGSSDTLQNNKNNDIIQPFDRSFEGLCQNLRIYNQQVYQIQGIVSRRQKCLANFMMVLSSKPSNKQLLEDHHRKKLRQIINPISYNSEINIQYATLNKKTSNQQMNLSKASSMTANQNTGQSSSQCQISFLMNHSNIMRYLEYLTIAGRKKFEAKAYLWHYKYANLEQAFNKLQSVVDQYYYATEP